VGTARDPHVEEIAEHLRHADVLDPAELRELIPSLLILEGVALRDSPPFDDEAIAGLRATNQRMLASREDPDAAALADDEFHRRLTARCGDAHVLEVIDVVRKELMRAERLYFVSPERVTQSVGEHEAIVAALEAGDHSLAAERVRDNFTSGMPGTDPESENPYRE
jgi:DNA-binding GntR family transcriptional regulator